MIKGRLVAGWASAILAVLIASSPHLADARQASLPAQKAINRLNAARRANGIPAGLRNLDKLSLGCDQYTSRYQPKPGQYPHEEFPSQSGYTKLGDLAARNSDLASGIFLHKEGIWGKEYYDSVWGSAPLHLARLFDPSARFAWYGQVGAPDFDSFCMGASAENPLAVGSTAPSTMIRASFFSLPGNGSREVPVLEAAAEVPFTPQQAAGLPGGRPTGPNIILFAEGPEATLKKVILKDPRGRVAGARIVRPSTPMPSFAGDGTVGEYTPDTWYVVPPKPLRGNTWYTLYAYWAAVERHHLHRQKVRFLTRCRMNGLGFAGAWPKTPGCHSLHGVPE